MPHAPLPQALYLCICGIPIYALSHSDVSTHRVRAVCVQPSTHEQSQHSKEPQNTRRAKISTALPPGREPHYHTMPGRISVSAKRKTKIARACHYALARGMGANTNTPLRTNETVGVGRGCAVKTAREDAPAALAMLAVGFPACHAPLRCLAGALCGSG